MVKKAKIPSGRGKNNSIITITVIISVLFFIFAGLYLFFSKQKQPAPVKHKTVAAKTTAPTTTTKKASSTPTKPKQQLNEKMLPGNGAKIAFILDDWGYRMSNCHFLKEIATPMAIAVLPNLKRTNEIMKCASLYDKDIMLHLPLEPYVNRDPYPDNYLITTKMSKSQVEKLVDETFKKMPMIVGVNNHMGSKATESATLMKIILNKVRHKGLFFVDSMTSPHHSVSGAIADELGVPFAQRDVFLDNVNTREAIEKQLVELAQKARKKGYAVAIGHDRQLTLQVLKDQIPTLQKQGFQIVSIRELLRNKK